MLSAQVRVLTDRVQRRAAVAHLTTAGSLFRWPALWLGLLAFVLSLPAAVGFVRIFADGVEFIDIGRRFSAGEGYTLGIKSHHFRGDDVLDDGLNGGPFYPVLIAVLLRAGFNLYGLQVVNALLSAGGSALVYAIGSSLFGRRTGVLAGLLAAASPLAPSLMVPPMTEAPAIFLSLLATWLTIRGVETRRVGILAAAGVAAGLAYLTRPTGLALAGALVLGAILARRDRRAMLRPLLAMLLGIAIVSVPVTLYSWSLHGPSLTYSGEGYHYSVFEATDINEQSFNRKLPTPIEFISANRGYVLAAILSNTRGYLSTIFLERNTLLLLLPAWPLALLALAGGRYPRLVWPVLLVLSANFLTYALTWSTFQRRYQILTILLLLPFAVDGLSRLGLAKIGLGIRSRVTALHLVVVAIALVWSWSVMQRYWDNFLDGEEPAAVRTYRGVTWLGEAGWARTYDAEVLDWISAATGRYEVLAHHNPWLFTLFTERPSTRLTRELDARRLREFIVKYHVSYVLIGEGDPDWRANLTSLRAMEADGVRSLAIGRYQVFDARSLWQEGRRERAAPSRPGPEIARDTIIQHPETGQKTAARPL